ncbi:MAG: methionine--tRNA ligase [Candidatus Thermoplasmatota archaeon]|nr:methionine--tRNA ligase [Candidatus Thermoplasmatota archaeon]
MSGEHVLICVAWPYANGPLHLGHVAGCYLPPDIQYRFERAMGNRVLMVSGSDEHGTPITVTAESQGVSPQAIVDKYHDINMKALLDLGCSWSNSIDARGPEFGGALFNRTSDEKHKRMVQDNFNALEAGGFFERKTTEQYYEVHADGSGRFLPDRYVEGTCPACGEAGARGDQCDACGATYEAVELKNPVSKMNPDANVEIRETDHLFYRLDLFQAALETHAQQQQSVWKANVKAMTKQWLDMGLRPRAVTRDLSWGIPVPLDGGEWDGKCIYVWFEAVQGYSTCARIWSQNHASELPDGEATWKRWWCVDENGTHPRHLYFLGKDNIPFHTVIWPALILGMNHVNNGLTADDPVALPGPGDFALEHNVPAMEYLMLAGGQFSKSRKHAVWLPSFLERYDPDTLRYYLSINMPENHDTDFNWPDFVERVNSELIAAYGNFVHRVLTLGARLPREGGASPFAAYDGHASVRDHQRHLEQALEDITTSLQRHRYKEALRGVMTVAQFGNQILQGAAPWKHLKEQGEGSEESLATLAFCWRIARFLAITTQPFLPGRAQRLWISLGYEDEVSDRLWHEAVDWEAPSAWLDEPPQPLFQRLDLDAILEAEQNLVEEGPEDDAVHGVKGGKKKGGKKMENEIEGVTYLEFDTFMKVNLRVGRIISVDDHPNADKLYVVKLDDGTGVERTICAGLKAFYQPDEMEGKLVVFVENLKPRPLRGVTSEGMMLAADDGEGHVRLITVDGDISTGSQVR